MKKSFNCSGIKMESSLSPLARSNTSKSGTTDDVSEEVGSKSSQPNEPMLSDHVRQNFPVKDVFLSYSDKQRNFATQLYRDLTNQGVSCFFHRESLTLGQDFPSVISQAINTCQIAVLLLSMDFLESKWTMMEISAFVDAKRTKPNFEILFLLFGISPTVIKPENVSANIKKSKLFNEITPEQKAKWVRNLRRLWFNNGLIFNKDDDEVKFRDRIAKAIWQLRTPPARYDYPRLQGESRMCQEVTSLFDKVRLNEKEIRIAGLYGIAGSGKTTLGKAFCNMKLKSFQGKVCHLEFGRGDSLERTKLALRYLTNCHQSRLQTLTSRDEAQIELHRRVKGERVFLVLDNFTEENTDEVVDYLKADMGEDSWILLTARSLDLLVHFKIDSQSCMCVPGIQEDEAISILLERISLEESTLGKDDRKIALRCAKRCSFNEGRIIHPLALKVLSRNLFDNYGSDLSKWDAETQGFDDGLGSVLPILDGPFEKMSPVHRTIFMLITVYMLPHMSPDKVTEWLAIICNKEISFIVEAIQDLCNKDFVEAIEPEIRIHDFYTEFAQMKAKKMGRWLWWKGDSPDSRGLISSEHNAGFELARLERCRHRQVDPRDLQNLLVLQLVDVQNMSNLDLGGMSRLRNITLQKCRDLKAIQGMEKLQHLAWLQIGEVNPDFELPELSKLEALQHLEINIAESKGSRLGDLTGCLYLREIKVFCPSLMEFPKLNNLPKLEKVEFTGCDKMGGALDCRDCVELHRLIVESRRPMTSSPLLTGCKKLQKKSKMFCGAVMQ